ncbi:MAG: VWA domain-containing protein [Oscillospiraceae bacterium]|nr:VWA domain-containing protein [Oscillospiraceae bacterium]
MKKFNVLQRAMGLFLCVALLAGYVPLTARAATPVAQSAVTDAVTDPGTASSWEHMMGTDIDGNRYAGRVWADKSVYKDGDTAVLNSRGEASSSFQVALEEDEAFQVIFSVLGSTMTSKDTIVSSGPMDVVLVLDTSTSMDDEDRNGVTRLERTITAANKLIDDLLALGNVRLAIVTYNKDSETVLPLDTYNNGVELVVTDYYNNNSSDAGVVTAYDNNRRKLGSDDGYTMGTNLQSGIDRGFNILANATGVKGRLPAAIVLTDGQANRASQEGFYELSSHTDKDGTSASNRNLYLSTLLNAAYTKTKIEANYGTDATVYTVGVDVSGNNVAQLLMNPADSTNGFKINSTGWYKDEITLAYEDFQTWASGQTVTNNGWTFDHNYPKLGGAITKEKIAANINYADTYYDVSNANLEDTFNQIYQELSSSAFNPITSSTSSAGGTGVDDTPLIYVDFIGQHMEIKEIEAITLFGASYGVIKHTDGTYTVTEATGTNPTTNERWNTAQDIKISVTKQTDGIQKLEIRINQEILPIIMERVESETVGKETTATITELIQEPLRVYYTVGVASDVLLPNGEVDVSKIQGYEYIDNNNGTVSFYSNQFGEENPADGSGVVLKGDAHVGFQPSPENRYYYYQKNQGIFTKITDSNGKTVTIPENNEYGIVWNAGEYDLTWMTYEAYQNMQDTDTIYNYVTYYHPTPDTGDAANAAEEVTYLVYSQWLYAKDSVAFYDQNTKTYLNDGKVTSQTEVEAYIQQNPNAEIYAVLGVGSRRTSRLHNMMHDKVSNDTGTAVESYTPEYLENKQDHHGNDVVIWLGNNGKLTVEVDTGIALTKAVTEAIGNADDNYELTVTVPTGVAANPVVLDASGNVVASSYSGNVLTVNVKAGQTVYVSGIPGGTVCTIGENVNGDYYIASKTDTVTVPKLSDVMAGAEQFAPATVTNAPYKYGDLTIIKDIDHDFDSLPTAMAGKIFTFKVELSPYTAGDKYQVDKANSSAFGGTEVVVGADGSFTVELKDNESITILGIPENTAYTVTEISNESGYTPVERVLTGTIQPDGDHDAHFVNVYGTTPIKPAVTVTGTKNLLDVNGTYTADEAFTFVLHQYIPGAAGSTGSYRQLAQATAKNGESYTFRLADVLTEALGIGEHYFRVTEESGTTTGMSYDSSRGMFVVHITDENADGNLEYAVENVGNTTVNGTTVTKDFVNTYDVARTHADINIVKIIGQNDTGVDIPLNLFHFELVNQTNPDNVQLAPQTVTTDAAGNATIRLTDLGPGEYTYVLAEKNEGMPGMRYDIAPRTVIVTVTEADGVLTASVTIDGAATNTATFRNDYILTAATNVITGVKMLQGREPQDGEFQFSLYETDASFVLAPGATPKQTVGNIGGTFIFDPITYTKVGTYYYSIKEVNTAVPGVTYDTTHYHVAVTVSAVGGGLTMTNIAVNKIGHNVAPDGVIAFVNTYKATPTEYAFSGHKILNGRAPRAHEFSFALYEGNELLQTVTNKADGSFSFDPITYTEAGEYTYTIKEVEGNVPGVTYDGANAPITVTVNVTDQGSYLSASADVENEAIQFVNTYTPANAKVVFNGEKYLHGDILEDNAFTFQLYVTDHTFEITDSAVQLIAEEQNVDGKFQFSGEFGNTGTYYFAIVEDTTDPVENVVYDRTKHTFMVQVSDDGDGQLKAVIINTATGDSTPEDALVSMDFNFINAIEKVVTDKEVYSAQTNTAIDGMEVKPGDVLSYYIIYRNYTGTDVAVEITDIIPAYTAYVEGSASHNGSYAGGHINWIVNVARGQSVTVSFDVVVEQIEEDATVTNTAIVRDGFNTYTTNTVSNPVDVPELPTEPTVPPTEPTVAPTEPTVPPTEPTVAPTEPTAPPTEPTVAPTEPTEPPTEPAVPPTEPTEPPAEPPAEPDLPQTGDNMNLHMWFAVLFVCSGGMIISFVLGKREKKPIKNKR